MDELCVKTIAVNNIYYNNETENVYRFPPTRGAEVFTLLAALVWAFG